MHGVYYHNIVHPGTDYYDALIQKENIIRELVNFNYFTDSAIFNINCQDTKEDLYPKGQHALDLQYEENLLLKCVFMYGDEESIDKVSEILEKILGKVDACTLSLRYELEAFAEPERVYNLVKKGADYLKPLVTREQSNGEQQIFKIVKDVDSIETIYSIYIEKVMKVNNKWYSHSPVFRQYNPHTPLDIIGNESKNYRNTKKKQKCTKIIHVMHAAGERIHTSYWTLEQIEPQKRINILHKICPYRGPGKENWLEPMINDHLNTIFNPPSLCQIVRKNIRDFIYIHDEGQNMFQAVHWLGLPSLLMNYLVFNVSMSDIDEDENDE